MIGCGIVGSTEGEVYEKGKSIGLVSGHAYSIQDLLEVTLKDGTKERLVRIRNPWGDKIVMEWNGRFCDSSKELRDNIEAINKRIIELNGEDEAELIDPKNMDDGMFFMTYDDFINRWHKLNICFKFDKIY